MAAKKGAKGKKTLGKKSMKSTKGGSFSWGAANLTQAKVSPAINGDGITGPTMPGGTL